MKAIFLRSTMVAGKRKLRWECPHCKKKFNLTPTRSKDFRCPDCYKLLEIKQ